MSNSITEVRTPEQLAQQAQSEVAADVSARTAPLSGEISGLQGRETTALGQIGSMFDKLQPAVTQEADAVTSSYDQANNASRAIFEEAKRRIDELANSRAQSAQALSQQMGGPVAVGEFTAGVEPGRSALASIAPNALLHGLANAQAGEQQARAFSERVFPAMRTEQTANARGYFEDQVKDLRKQIDTINASSTGLVSSRLNELQTQERQYALNQAQLKLDQTKADRDWEATKKTLANDTARLNLAKKEFGVQEAGVTGKYKGKPTMQSVKLAVEQRLAAQRMGLSAAQYQERVRHNTESEAIQRSKIANSQQSKAMSILDSVTGRSKSGATITERVAVDKTAGALAIAKGNTKVHYDPKTKTYYTYETTHLSAEQMNRRYGSGFASDPQQLYDLLIGSNIPKAMAMQMVRAKTGVSDFTPGQPTQYTASDLSKIGKRSFNELRGIALARGFKPNKKHPANTQMLIDYIMSTNQ